WPAMRAIKICSFQRGGAIPQILLELTHTDIIPAQRKRLRYLAAIVKWKDVSHMTSLRLRNFMENYYILLQLFFLVKPTWRPCWPPSTIMLSFHITPSQGTSRDMEWCVTVPSTMQLHLGQTIGVGVRETM